MIGNRVGRVLTMLLLVSTPVVGTAAPLSKDDAIPRALRFSDQSPTVAIFGLPRAEGYGVTARGRWQAGLRLDYTSHYSDQDGDGERLRFDGETTRVSLRLTRGLANDWQIHIELPLVAHSGGFADGFVEDFHDAFGFPDGGRSNAPENRQSFRYRRDGRAVFDVSDSPSGLGDLRLGLKKRLAGAGDWGMAVAGELKLPTGDADRLTGSGAADLALWAVLGNNQTEASPWRLLAGAGGIHTGGGDVLDDQRVRTVPFGWATIGYALRDDFVLSVQANAHGPFYDETAIEALDGTAVQGAAGFDWRIGPRSTLEFAIVEDLNTGASPDVSFLLGLRHGY